MGQDCSRDGINQIRNVVDLLRRKPGSRQAIVQIVDRRDIPDKVEDIPCTCVLQFLGRHGKLDMVTYMRSNDAFLGLPHDIFCFTMLQEIICMWSWGRAREPTPTWWEVCTLYDSDRVKAEQFLQEGFQSTAPIMPSWMPQGSRLGSNRSAAGIGKGHSLWAGN